MVKFKNLFLTFQNKPFSQIKNFFLSLSHSLCRKIAISIRFGWYTFNPMQCIFFSFPLFAGNNSYTNIQWTTWNIRRVQLYFSIERHTLHCMRLHSNADNFSSTKANLWFSFLWEIVHLLLDSLRLFTLLCALSDFLYISTDKLFTQAQIERYILSVCFSFDTVTTIEILRV